MNPPPNTQVRIDEVKPGTWTVVIPGRLTPRLVVGSLFLLCWLAGLAVGATFGLRSLMHHEEWRRVDLTLGLWFVAWVAMGVIAMGLLRRCLEIAFGKEGLLFQPKTLTVQRVLWEGVTRKTYELSRVDGFTAGRTLRFRYGLRWISVGASLTDGEIVWLEGELNRILKEVKAS